VTAIQVAPGAAKPVGATVGVICTPFGGATVVVVVDDDVERVVGAGRARGASEPPPHATAATARSTTIAPRAARGFNVGRATFVV
jgi:hypothetical protein